MLPPRKLNNMVDIISKARRLVLNWISKIRNINTILVASEMASGTMFSMVASWSPPKF